MITFNQKGDFKKLTKYLKKSVKLTDHMDFLNKYGDIGVEALAAATPIDTGKTADSWGYKIAKEKRTVSIEFYNSNIQNGVNIAIILQNGHATRNGGWVEGRNYIPPAIQPIFDKMTSEAWKEVSKI